MKPTDIRLIVVLMAILLGAAACDEFDWLTGGGGESDEGACKQALKCGQLATDQDRKDCEIWYKASLKAHKIVKDNAEACESLYEEYKNALKCIADLDCEDMADTDESGQSEIDECWEDYMEEVNDVYDDQDDCQSCFPEDRYCWEDENFQDGNTDDYYDDYYSDGDYDDYCHCTCSCVTYDVIDYMDDCDMTCEVFCSDVCDDGY